MKNILGLDLGTNSIGWALIEIDHENGIVRILGLGARILPMDADEINDFQSKGTIKSTTAQRTDDRGVRRNKERFLLRRDRLHLILNLLNALPEHYKIEIDFERNGEKCGQFKNYKEPKLAYIRNRANDKRFDFLFEDSYNEMLNEFGVEYKKRKLIPRDWTLYYLRQKALTQKIALEELAWVLLSYNQKRGYEKNEVEDKTSKENEIVEVLDLRVKNVTEIVDKEGGKYFKVELNCIDNIIYNEYSDIQMTFENDLKEIKVITKIDDSGNTTSKEFSVLDIFSLKIKEVNYEKQEDKHNYTITYLNGWKEIKTLKKYTFRYKNVINKPFEYIVETVYDEKGNIKPILGKFRKLREPDFGDNSNDWTLLKKKTEKEALAYNIENGYINKNTGEPKKYLSPQIFHILKNDAQSGNRTKIIGGMFQVIEREFYREELAQIISTQKQYYTNLNDRKTFEKCVQLLYPNNEAHAKSLMANKKAIQQLLIEDILLYQRPLKSKKSEIANCKYEIRQWKDAIDKKTGKPVEEIDIETGEICIKKEPIYHKVVSTSHPYFQEFRIWDKLHNLRLIQIEKEAEGKIKTNVDVTDDYFKNDTYQKLFQLLNNKSTLKQSGLLDFLKSKFEEKNENAKNFVWNLPENEEIKGNETRVSFTIRFKRCGLKDYNKLLTKDKEIALWHYLYSVSYKERIADDFKSIKSFFSKFLDGVDIPDIVKDNLIKDFANYPKFASKYCAYSEKALKKLLPFIRIGEFNDSFDITEFSSDLNAINYDKSMILSYIKYNPIDRMKLSPKESIDLEIKRRNLYKAIWEHSINERIKEIRKRLDTIDFEVDEVDFSKVVSNDSNNGNIPFPKGLFNAFKALKTSDKPKEFTNLNLAQASYLVYGRHSELAQAKYWTSPKQIRDELHQELKLHSLNNPVAERVILEMIQIVADIWDYYGDGKDKFFSEIHLEVGRDLKKSAKEKQNIINYQNENKAQNKRLRQVLEDFLSKSPYNAIPQNSDHFERLKVMEDGAAHTKNTDKNFFIEKSYTKKEIDEILKKPNITQGDFDKYKLWIEQGYKSPYTNRIIKLTDLFNGNKYNIDHVFPQASVTNDSLINKVVCEREINTLKSKQTGRDFINNPSQRRISCEAHKTKENPKGIVEIVNDNTYVSIVKTQFSGHKRQILLSKEIPANFTNSQLNNARHIARKAMELLSHIVREPGEVEFRSKNVLPVTGEVTSKLKKAWRLDEVWRELVAPRFMRMNELTKSNLFGQEQISKSGAKYFDCNIDNSIREKDPSYDIKRIDHRHHALDALIVALCTEDHVNYINNINANVTSEDHRKQKQIEKYRETLKRKIMFSKPNKENPKVKDWFYMLPGQRREAEAETSTIDTVLRIFFYFKDTGFNMDYKSMVLSALEHTIVTYKQNLRVINKTVNRYNNTPNKNKFEIQKDKEADNQYNWAIRRSLGKDTYYGKVNLKLKEKNKLHSMLEAIFENVTIIVDKELKKQIIEIKANSNLKHFKKKIKELYRDNPTFDFYYFTDTTKDSKKIASREFLSDKFYSKKILEITDTGIQKILLNHLKQFDTVKLRFEEALQYFDALKEKPELESILNKGDSKFNTLDDLINYLKSHENKYDKVDYSELNVFIEQVHDRDFRADETFKDIIDEHPEIAFSVDQIDLMNQAENIKKLNDGKNHAPIRKVRSSRGFGNQRQVSDDLQSVKSKQYIVNDAGSNLYLGFYEGVYEDNKITERKFQDIGLMELIEILKQDKSKRLNPLPQSILDERKNTEYNWLFTLSPLDLVFVPNEEEIENPSLVNLNILNKEQIKRVYTLNNFTGGDIYFSPNSHAKSIHEKEVDLKFDTKTSKLKGSFPDKTTSISSGSKTNQIKNICYKLEVDKLGNIPKPNKLRID